MIGLERNEGSTSTEIREGLHVDDSPKIRYTERENPWWYMRYRYYAVQEAGAICEIVWEHACDDVDATHQAYFARVAANHARWGAPQHVVLLDVEGRKVLAATVGVNEEATVQQWLGSE